MTAYTIVVALLGFVGILLLALEPAPVEEQLPTAAFRSYLAFLFLGSSVLGTCLSGGIALYLLSRHDHH